MRRDDCWLTKDRDASGNLQVDKRAFPDGLEPVIAHVHSKGLCATPTPCCSPVFAVVRADLFASD